MRTIVVVVVFFFFVGPDGTRASGRRCIIQSLFFPGHMYTARWIIWLFCRRCWRCYGIISGPNSGHGCPSCIRPRSQETSARDFSDIGFIRNAELGFGLSGLDAPNHLFICTQCSNCQRCAPSSHGFWRIGSQLRGPCASSRSLPRDCANRAPTLCSLDDYPPSRRRQPHFACPLEEL